MGIFNSNNDSECLRFLFVINESVLKGKKFHFLDSKI